MKRIIVLCAAVLLFGCAGASEPAAEPAAPAETEAPAVTEQPAADTPAEEPAAPAELPSDIMSFLDGVWTLRTNDPASDGYAVLAFRSDEKTVSVTAQDDRSVKADAEVFDSDPSSGISGDAVRFNATEASEELTGAFGNNMIIYGSDMQYFAGTYKGEDYLFLRELGNGLSVIDSEVLREENETGDHGWVFTREDSVFPDAGEEGKMPAGTHYAFCWKKDSTGYLLQEAEVIEKTEDWYGEEINTLRVIPSMERISLYLYNSDSLPEQFSPGLFQVTVDEAGTVTAAEPVEYIGYGAYRAL